MRTLYILSFLFIFSLANFCHALHFKMGIELQESHNLCGWAKSSPAIQKKPLFSFEDATVQRKLGHVVIDGADIEFVLESFASN